MVHWPPHPCWQEGQLGGAQPKGVRAGCRGYFCHSVYRSAPQAPRRLAQQRKEESRLPSMRAPPVSQAVKKQGPPCNHIIKDKEHDMAEIKPTAVALPRPNEKIEPGRYGSMMPVTPANGFTLICKVKPGSGDATATDTDVPAAMPVLLSIKTRISATICKATKKKMVGG